MLDTSLQMLALICPQWTEVLKLPLKHALACDGRHVELCTFHRHAPPASRIAVNVHLTVYHIAKSLSAVSRESETRLMHRIE